METIEAKDFRTFIRVYSLFKSEQLSANIKLTLHKPLIRSIMAYACPAWEFETDNQPSTEITAPAKQGSPHHWQFSKTHADLRFAHGFQTSVHI
jgi:hypothetical protein